MTDVHPAGADVVLALAAWNRSAPSWTAMLAGANQTTRAGVIAFDQPTVDPGCYNCGPPLLSMNQDLVLSSIPEPSALALVAMGGLLLLLSRHRRHLGRRGL